MSVKSEISLGIIYLKAQMSGLSEIESILAGQSIQNVRWRSG
jgi:hypothetical protein